MSWAIFMEYVKEWWFYEAIIIALIIYFIVKGRKSKKKETKQEDKVLERLKRNTSKEKTLTRIDDDNVDFRKQILENDNTMRKNLESIKKRRAEIKVKGEELSKEDEELSYFEDYFTRTILKED